MSEIKKKSIFKKEGITIDNLLDMIYAQGTASWGGAVSVDKYKLNGEVKSEILQIPSKDGKPPTPILVYKISLNMSHHAQMIFHHNMGLNPNERPFHRSILAYGAKFVVEAINQVTKIVESMQNEELK